MGKLNLLSSSTLITTVSLRRPLVARRSFGRMTELGRSGLVEGWEMDCTEADMQQRRWAERNGTFLQAQVLNEEKSRKCSDELLP